MTFSSLLEGTSARPLLVPATDIDSARRVVFGEPPWDDVPISTAVAASSAIPTFFEPVSVRGRHLVDGNVGKVAHLDLAVSRGVRRVLVVSPLAPVENGAGLCVVPGEDGTCLSLSERGFWAIHNQAFRIENQVRLHLGIGKFLSETPELRIDLIEPDPADATLFLANPMSLAARREILEGAYAQARGALEASFRPIVQRGPRRLQARCPVGARVAGHDLPMDSPNRRPRTRRVPAARGRASSSARGLAR